MIPLFEIKRSTIAGKGVFAIQNIYRNKTITFLDGELCSLREIIKRVKEGDEHISDPLAVAEEEYIDLDEISRTFNHSCNPNAFIRGKNELVALKDIKKGQEITYDYSTTMSEDENKIKRLGWSLWNCVCHCGSPHCRGIIDQFETLPQNTRYFYLHNKLVPEFILRMHGNTIGPENMHRQVANARSDSDGKSC